MFVVGTAAKTATDSGYENVFGWNVTSAGADRTTLGSGGSDSVLVDGGTTWAAVSDIRTKKDIVSSTIGLSFINDLRTVTFDYRTLGELPENHKHYEEGSEEIYKRRPERQLGFIAQDVKEATRYAWCS